MNTSQKRLISRKKRHHRIRKHLSGTSERPRLAVFRSAKHIYVQAIDDQKQCTLGTASTLDKEVSEQLNSATGGKSAAEVVGKVIAERLLKQSVSNVVFDRGGFLYHGRIKSLAEGARQAGLTF